MRTIDVFPLANELDILEIRLYTLRDTVDLFVIYEWSTDFRGKPKPLWGLERLEHLKQITPNILYIPFSEVQTEAGFEGERIQRDAIKGALSDICLSGDLVLYSDIDEIPRPTAIKDAAKLLVEGARIVHFAQDFFMYYLNLMEINGRLLSYTGEYPDVIAPKWLGTRMMTWDSMREFTMSELRYPSTVEYGVRLPDAGWHFSWVGSSNSAPASHRVLEKVRHYHSHLEELTFAIEWRVRFRLLLRRDVWGRRGVKFRPVGIDQMPAYVQENLEKFKYALVG